MIAKWHDLRLDNQLNVYCCRSGSNEGCMSGLDNQLNIYSYEKKDNNKKRKRVRILKKTIENCRLVRKYGMPEEANGKCFGLSKVAYDDEPCDTCKNCKLFYLNDDDE